MLQYLICKLKANLFISYFSCVCHILYSPFLFSFRDIGTLYCNDEKEYVFSSVSPSYSTALTDFLGQSTYLLLLCNVFSCL